MQNTAGMVAVIRNEKEFKDRSQKLESLYGDIIRLIMEKEKYEKQIDDYLKKKKEK